MRVAFACEDGVADGDFRNGSRVVDFAVSLDDDVDFVFRLMGVESDAGSGREDQFGADTDMRAAEILFVDVFFERDSTRAAFHVDACFEFVGSCTFDHVRSLFLMDCISAAGRSPCGMVDRASANSVSLRNRRRSPW